MFSILYDGFFFWFIEIEHFVDNSGHLLRDASAIGQIRLRTDLIKRIPVSFREISTQWIIVN